jgi:hypothetical protein
MKMRDNKFDSSELDVESIRYFMKFSAKQKLEILQRLNSFFKNAMSDESKEISERLKQEGF